jgi:type IV secretory pathway VirB6-like protein
MVGVVGSTIANSIATKASEETAQAAIAANAKAKSDAANAALQKALAAEKTKQLGMELEAGAAAVVPTPVP